MNLDVVCAADASSATAAPREAPADDRAAWAELPGRAGLRPEEARR